MNTKILSFALCIMIGVLLFACEKKSSDEWPEFTLIQPDDISDEEYELYSLVINELYSSSEIIIRQRSIDDIWNIPEGFFEYPIDLVFLQDNSLYVNFQEMNDTAYYFDEKFTAEEKVIHLISTDELAYIFDGTDLDENWETFYSIYPEASGFNKLSRIGFNDSSTLAVFEIGHYFFSLGASGYLVFLQKTNDQWTVENVIMIWTA